MTANTIFETGAMRLRDRELDEPRTQQFSDIFKVVAFVIAQTIGITLYVSGMRHDIDNNAAGITQVRSANNDITRKVDDLTTQINSVVLKTTALDINVTNQGKILETNSKVLDDINQNIEQLTYGRSNGVTGHR